VKEMDAVTLINQNLNIDMLLEHYNFDGIKDDGEMIRACCKLHGGNNPTAFVINRESGLWYCHTNCGGGDVYTLVQKMEKVDFSSAVRWLANLFGIDITNLRINERQEVYLKDIKNFILMMRKHKQKELVAFYINEPIKEVIAYRKFKEETLNNFGVGYVKNVKLKKKDGKEYCLTNRLVFPIIFKNIQVGISFRRTKTKDIPKWSHQPANVETGDYLYNYDATLGKDTIVICEGITDVLAFYEVGIVAVATFGAHITDAQYKMILKTGCSNIVLAFDGDSAGREITKKAIGYVDNGKKIKGIFEHKANLSIISFNEGEDPESIEREELMKRYESRKKL